MRCIFERIVFTICCVLIFVLGHAQAFDHMADVDEASGKPLEAYGLYLGMQWGDMLNKCSKLNGWVACKSEIPNVQNYFKSESLNGSVKESLSIMRYPDESDVAYYRVYFMTDSLKKAERIFETLSDNIEYDLGRYEYNESNPDYSSKRLYYSKSKYWRNKGKLIRVDIVYSLGDRCDQFDSQGILFKTKFAVSITRRVYKGVKMEIKRN